MAETYAEYAGFWRRFAAYVIDWVVLTFFLNTIYWYVFHQIDVSREIEHDLTRAIARYVVAVLSVFITWSYYSGMESSPFQATIGKLAVGLYVTNSNGQRISFGRATGRHFAKIVSGLILAVGYLLAAWTPRKQALHDMIAGCLVLRR